MSRVFVAKPAVREQVPVLVGLTGPSGSGKTWSALRLATGMQTVSGGDIYGVDTEARRMLHYADSFKFKHVQFDAPFGSFEYLDCLQQCVKAGAKNIIVDSQSHEHDGPGGLIDFQEAELERLGGSDKVKMLAWVKPKTARRRLISGILQLNANIIFCFRAKHISKPVKQAGGKTEIIDQGFVPIAGDEFIYELMVNVMLMPKSGGVPTWNSEYPGERMAMKLPEQFKGIFAQSKPLDEDIGRQLAEWAGGKVDKGFSDLSARLDATTTADGLNAMLAEGKKLPDNQKARWWELVKRRAVAVGLPWDAKDKSFKGPGPNNALSDEERSDFLERVSQSGLAQKEIDDLVKEAGGKSLTTLTRDQAAKFTTLLDAKRQAQSKE